MTGGAAAGAPAAGAGAAGAGAVAGGLAGAAAGGAPVAGVPAAAPAGGLAGAAGGGGVWAMASVAQRPAARNSAFLVVMAPLTVPACPGTHTFAERPAGDHRTKVPWSPAP